MTLEHRANTERWQDFMHRAENLLANLTKLGKQMFSQETTRKLPMWVEANTRSLVARKWRRLHHARMAHQGSATLTTCLQAWNRVTGCTNS